MITPNGASIFLNWTAPFSLQDNISYCVDVHNNKTSSLLSSECGINNTEFDYLLTQSFSCVSYQFNVIPVNLVGNGTANSKTLGPTTSMILL